MRTRAAAPTTARRPSGSRHSTSGSPAPSWRGGSKICFAIAERAPYAAQNHPTAEHFLPLFVTLGAAYDDEPGVRIHASYDRGLLSLDAYAFGLTARAARDPAPLGRRCASRSTLGTRYATEADHPGARGRLAACCSPLRSSSLQTTESDGSATSELARIAAFLTWQAAGVRRRGARRVRDAVRGLAGRRARQAVGYVPLALSVFLVASFIALMGFRFYVAPLFE